MSYSQFNIINTKNTKNTKTYELRLDTGCFQLEYAINIETKIYNFIQLEINEKIQFELMKTDDNFYYYIILESGIFKIVPKNSKLRYRIVPIDNFEEESEPFIIVSKNFEFKLIPLPAPLIMNVSSKRKVSLNALAQSFEFVRKVVPIYDDNQHKKILNATNLSKYEIPRYIKKKYKFTLNVFETSKPPTYSLESKQISVKSVKSDKIRNYIPQYKFSNEPVFKELINGIEFRLKSDELNTHTYNKKNPLSSFIIEELNADNDELTNSIEYNIIPNNCEIIEYRNNPLDTTQDFITSSDRNRILQIKMVPVIIRPERQVSINSEIDYTKLGFEWGNIVTDLNDKLAKHKTLNIYNIRPGETVNGYYMNIYDISTPYVIEMGHLSIHKSRSTNSIVKAGHFKFAVGRQEISLLNRLLNKVSHDTEISNIAINITLLDKQNQIKFIYLLPESNKLSTFVKGTELELLELILETLNEYFDKISKDARKYLKYKNKYLKLKNKLLKL